MEANEWGEKLVWSDRITTMMQYIHGNLLSATVQIPAQDLSLVAVIVCNPYQSTFHCLTTATVSTVTRGAHGYWYSGNNWLSDGQKYPW